MWQIQTVVKSVHIMEFKWVFIIGVLTLLDRALQDNLFHDLTKSQFIVLVAYLLHFGPLLTLSLEALITFLYIGKEQRTQEQ